ncbi:MAG TPA: hypothetical protein VEJ87_04345 [Acidimicrobiales bacterium]|nr:hypothetical protein [Acidimicrobiales bacterium]
MYRKLATAVLIAGTLSLGVAGAASAASTTTTAPKAEHSKTSSHAPGTVGGTVAAWWAVVDQKFAGCNRAGTRIARLEEVVKKSQALANRSEANLAENAIADVGKPRKHPKEAAALNYLHNRTIKNLNSLTARAEREISKIQSKCNVGGSAT